MEPAAAISTRRSMPAYRSGAFRTKLIEQHAMKTTAAVRREFVPASR